MGQPAEEQHAGNSSLRATLTGELRRIGSTRAYQCFAVCWIGAATYLLLTPHRQTVFIAVSFGLIGLIHWLFTLRFVPPTPIETEPHGTGGQRWRLRLQLAVILYAVLPLVLLLLLGTGWRELGFGRGHYSLRMTVIWSFEAIGALLVVLLLGQMTGLALGSHALQNGFMEEFLFRGALQTRLVRLLDPAWGLVLSALVFGLWHIGLSVTMTNGDLVAGTTRSILLHGSSGLFVGYIFSRTRNLLAPSLVHILTKASPF